MGIPAHPVGAQRRQIQGDLARPVGGVDQEAGPAARAWAAMAATGRIAAVADVIRSMTTSRVCADSRSAMAAVTTSGSATGAGRLASTSLAPVSAQTWRATLRTAG